MERVGVRALDSGATAEANRGAARFVATAEANKDAVHFVATAEGSKEAARFGATPVDGRLEERSGATAAAEASCQVSGPANSHAPHQRA